MIPSLTYFATNLDITTRVRPGIFISRHEMQQPWLLVDYDDDDYFTLRQRSLARLQFRKGMVCLPCRF